MGRVFITGDTHSNFERIEYFCSEVKTSKDDLMIILGDAGINYYGGKRDKELKRYLQSLPITFFCIRGNHEMRPRALPELEEDLYVFPDKSCLPRLDIVYFEKEFPNILYAKDGGAYKIDTPTGAKSMLTIGGAYSVDKQYRLDNGWAWFADEQLTEEERERIAKKANKIRFHDFVLTHTIPVQWEPTECFLPFIDQSSVDKTMENWLADVERNIVYDRWYAGHYHVDKTVNEKVRLLYHDIIELQ